MKYSMRGLASCGVVLVLQMVGVRSSIATDVVINEFQAVNNTTLINEQGDSPDWIELYNVSSNTVNLDGWYLTDNDGDLTKSRLPAVTLDPFDYLLVFADGDTNTLVDGDVHADFKLSSSPEFLGLVRPDGITIEAAFSPEYPEQEPDVSFGLRPVISSFALVAAEGSSKYLIPSDGSLGTNWTALLFDDGSWSDGDRPVGFQNPAGDYTGVLGTTFPVTTKGVYLRHSFEAVGADTFDILTLRVKFDDAFVAYLNGVKVMSIHAPSNPQWNDAALVEHPNEEALFFEDYDLSDHVDLVQEGTNVLSIHVMTFFSSPHNTDMLLDVELNADAFQPSVSDEWRYFHEPTPGMRNVLGDEDFVREVEFDHERGFYSEPFDLALSVNLESFEIRYTLDGTTPDGTNALLYAGPLPITGTTVVRARGYRSSLEPSPAVTHTFLFTDDIVQQSTMSPAVVNDPVLGPRMDASLKALPTLSIATGNENLFGAASGIYTNPLNRGVDWERPASVEWINPDGTEGFHINAGLRIYGGFFRNAPKKSFRLLFKGIYGATKLKYPVFKDESAVDFFDTLILRAGGNDPFVVNGLVDPFLRNCLLATGQPGSHSTFVHLYLDGVYWGIYNPSERCDQAFGASYFNVEKEEWDGLNAGFPTGESQLDTYNAMLNAVSGGNLSANAVYQALQGKLPDGSPNPGALVHLDVDNHIDYMMTHFWGGTRDWPWRNWYAGGARTNSTGWKFFAWDTEFSLNSLTLMVTQTAGPGGVHGQLMQSDEYRLRFADHVHKHYFNGGAFTPGALISRYQALVDIVEPAIGVNAARWGDAGSPSTWRSKQDSLLSEYLPVRTAISLDQFRFFLVALYPSIPAPEFNQYGATFSDTFQLEISASNSVYYTLDGTDPRQPGSSDAVGTPYSQPVTLNGSALVKARARDGADWSALTEAFFTSDKSEVLRITEIMANPYGPTQGSPYASGDFEFIEVWNSGAEAVNLAFVTFSDGVDFTFPGLVLNAGEYVVVVRNLEAFDSRYGTAGITIAGEFAGALNDGGERVTLKASPEGVVVSTFDYADGRGWPDAADGGGHSLVPLVINDQAGGVLDYGGNWRASAYRGGSPGEADPPPLRDVLINEVAAHTDYTNAAFPEFDSNDWLELYNTGVTPVSLDDWYLSDDLSDLKKWAIPTGHVVAAADWILFDEVNGFHNPTNTGFGLDKGGERAVLSYLPGTSEDRIADVVRFKGQESGTTLGRYPDGSQAWFTMLPTTNAPNALPADRVIISELMYHPSEALEASVGVDLEYIELYNGAGLPVNLWNEAGSWRIAGGVSFTFPTNIVLPADAYLLLVSFDPADAVSLHAFLDAYGDTNVPSLVFGPFSGQLSNEGERIALEQPLAPDLPEEPVSWSIVDEVIYFDSVNWPLEADGSGVPLQRVSNGGDGNLAATWTGSLTASPGRARDKIGMTAPIQGETFFVPAPLPLTAILDDQQIVGDLEKVEFLLDGAVVGVVTQAPYSFQFGGITSPAMYMAASRIVDDGGTNASSAIPVEYVLLETLAPAFITDQAARLNGSLSGNASGEITYYWGKSDGETNASAWDHSGLIGTVNPGAFLAEVGNLDAGSVYYARAYGENGLNNGWASNSQVFSTMAFNQWSNRMSISFPGYADSEELKEFTALVIFSTNIAGFTYDDFQPDVSDLRFSTTNGVGLNYEIESWDPLGFSYVWVNIPTLSTQEQAIIAYWGNANSVRASTYAAIGGAWDDDYRAVWHLNGNFVDSTEIGVIGVISGASNASGVVSAGLTFDGVDDFVNPRIFNDWYGENIDDLSISLWVKPDNNNPGSPFGTEDLGGNGDLNIRAILGGNWIYTVSDQFSLIHPMDVNEWQMLTIVLTNFQALGYWNDDPADVIGIYTQFVPIETPFVGMISLAAGSEFIGEIDEVRVSGVARSAARVGASYDTVAMHDAFTAYAMLDVDDPDFDKDGLPDAWEREHFGGEGVSSGDEDTDLDGLDDIGEYVAGTIPTNSDDVFFLYTGSSGGETDLRFDMIPAAGPYYTDLSRFYALQGAAAPSNLWADLPGATNIPAIAGPFIYTNFTAPTNPVYFYRGKVSLQPTVTN